MRVLQFITRLDLGGAQETCLDLCRLLIERGDEAHLLTGEGGELMPEARAIRGLTVHAWPDWHHPIRPWSDLRCAARLVRLLRQERFDVLHTHSSKAGLIGRLAAAVAGAPPGVVHHVQGWAFNRTQPWPVRAAFVALERIAARRGFVLLSCSRATDRQGREARIGRDEDRRVVPNGIDRRINLKSRDREALRRREGLGRRDLLFLQLGNLKPQKDPLTFARAAAVAAGALPRGAFWIAGDGPLRAEVERLARRERLSDRLRVLGWRRDVPELLAAADVLVLGSRFEGLPLAVLRGMAAGLPVVATAVDGTPEAVVHGRTGLLVEPRDVAGLARAMVRMGRDPGLRRRMGTAGRIRSAAFSDRRTLPEILALYPGAIARRSSVAFPARAVGSA